MEIDPYLALFLKSQECGEVSVGIELEPTKARVMIDPCICLIFSRPVFSFFFFSFHLFQFRPNPIVLFDGNHIFRPSTTIPTVISPCTIFVKVINTKIKSVSFYSWSDLGLKKTGNNVENAQRKMKSSLCLKARSSR
jgi:hypothetical protein